MKKAYSLLGVLIAIVFIGAYIAVQRAEAPTPADLESPITNNVTNEAASRVSPESMALLLTSPAFGDGAFIPSKYTCDGENINPELNISGVPEGTVSLVLLMDDPDIPNEIKESRGITKFDHWTIFNMGPVTTQVTENSVPVGVVGKNGGGNSTYTGPCPPPQYEPKVHRYFFKLYALNTMLNLTEEATQDEIVSAMKNHIMEETALIGRYERTGE